VQNTQSYNFDRGHSVWRRLLLPHGDLQLSVLTRLTLSSEHKVGGTGATLQGSAWGESWVIMGLW